MRPGRFLIFKGGTGGCASSEGNKSAKDFCFAADGFFPAGGIVASAKFHISNPSRRTHWSSLQLLSAIASRAALAE